MLPALVLLCNCSLWLCRGLVEASTLRLCDYCIECPLVGLILASIVVDLSGAAQPALLYLVPTTLLPLLLKATIQVANNHGMVSRNKHMFVFMFQGDFRIMWDGPHFTAQPKPYQHVSKVLPF